jgi:hypothetical protein
MLHKTIPDWGEKLFRRFPKDVKTWTAITSIVCVLLMVTITWYGAIQKAYTPDAKLRELSPYISYRVEADEVSEQSAVNMTVQGSVIVEAGGKLTLTDSTLTIDSEEDGLQRITVEENAELVIQNSTVKAKDPDLRYEFVVLGTLLIDNSTVQDAYGEGKVGGLQLYGSQPKEIRNSVIKDAATTGIYVYDSTPVLNNVTIRDWTSSARPNHSRSQARARPGTSSVTIGTSATASSPPAPRPTTATLSKASTTASSP